MPGTSASESGCGGNDEPKESLFRRNLGMEMWPPGLLTTNEAFWKLNASIAE